MENVNEYVQEIPQPHTADQPTAAWGRAKNHLQASPKFLNSVNKVTTFTRV